MKSIPVALTWEFWRQAGFSLLATVVLLSGLMALLYGGLRLDKSFAGDTAVFRSLQMFCFIFVVVHLAAVICATTGAPHYRFTLPVSTRASILVPMLNGAIATAIGYLTIALLVNWFVNAQWALLKPTIIAVCMISVCHAVAWLIGSSSNLRGAVVALVSTILGVVVINLNGIQSTDQFTREWQTIRPLDIAIAIIVPISAYSFSIVAHNLARRGQTFSMSAFGRWLLAKLDVRFGSGTHAMTPMAAELWSEWSVRGRVMPAGALLGTIVLCGFFLSGRFEWSSARIGIAVVTWFQVIGGGFIGLFLGHVGERFDFHEHLATRPLSDIQLADVKLRNTLKSVLWTWVTWAFGVGVAVVCLTLVGQGPKSWSDLVPPDIHPLVPVLIVVMIPLGSWTVTSFCASIAILRPRMLISLLCMLMLLPAIPYTLLLLMPKDEVPTALRWIWNGVSIVGTISLYVMAYRLRLITTKRVAVVGVAYLLFCAVTWWSLDGFLPPPEMPFSLALGCLLSTCILPFVCIAAVPLAIWWNRHR